MRVRRRSPCSLASANSSLRTIVFMRAGLATFNRFPADASSQAYSNSTFQSPQPRTFSCQTAVKLFGRPETTDSHWRFQRPKTRFVGKSQNSQRAL